MEGQPIIVKRVVKKAAGHHGGSWKVAFADFATAMMAFFMVMWLLATASPVQKKAIEGYFKDPVGFAEGGSANPIDLGGSASVVKATSADIQDAEIVVPDSAAAQDAETIEQQKLQDLMQDIKEKIENTGALQQFKDQLILDITDEGLRIQIVDRTKRPMFDAGQAILKAYSEDLLFELAKPLSSVNNKISITGHTDSVPFAGKLGYTNWDLSSERANAARRSLVGGGVREAQIARVVGLAGSVSFDPQDSTSPVNRRIAIIVLKNTVAAEPEKPSKDAVIDLTSPTAAEHEAATKRLENGDWFKPAPPVKEKDVRW